MPSLNPFPNPLHASVINKLDPQFTEIYNKYQDQVTYEEYNSNRPKYTFPIAPGPRPDVGSEKIYQIPVLEPGGEIALQVLCPTDDAVKANRLATKDEKLPAHVNYHGGGFVIGSLESDSSWCRQACQTLGCIIVNVDYRLAPDFPHPTPLTDAWTALKWVFANAQELNIDVSRISVGGLSAGANLAAVVAVLARDEPDVPRLVCQLLTVPVIDVRFVPVEGSADSNGPYKSYFENEFAPCLPLRRLSWFYRLWLGENIELRKQRAEDFRASPILASSHANLAPASIHIAGVDPLASEGEAYHDVLTKAGTKSQLKVYEGVGHPFGHWDGELDKAKEYTTDTFEALRKVYSI